MDEALRLYPPAAFLSRTARIHDSLGGREVLPGDTVMLPIYALHRHHLLWDDPDAFRPERFLPENRKAIDRYAYIPFSAGPRVCIGAAFALSIWITSRAYVDGMLGRPYSWVKTSRSGATSTVLATPRRPNFSNGLARMPPMSDPPKDIE